MVKIVNKSLVTTEKDFREGFHLAKNDDDEIVLVAWDENGDVYIVINLETKEKDVYNDEAELISEGIKIIKNDYDFIVEFKE